MSKKHSFTQDQVQTLHEAFKFHLKKDSKSLSSSLKDESSISKSASPISSQNPNLNFSQTQLQEQSHEQTLGQSNDQDKLQNIENSSHDNQLNEKEQFLPLRDFMKLVREYLGLRIFTKDNVLDFLKENHPDFFSEQISKYDDIYDIEINFEKTLEILDSKFMKTQTKKQKIKQVFDEIGLGAQNITPMDVSHLFKRYLGESLTNLEIKGLVEMMDTSHDEKISIEEWETSMTNILRNQKDFE